MNSLIQKKSGSALVLTINRPEVMNAISGQLAQDLHSSILSAENDKSIRAIVITGIGDRAFSAGMDLK